MNPPRLIPSNHYAARKHNHETRYFLYVSTDSVFDEKTGETYSRTELPQRILGWLGNEDETPVICCNDAPSVLKELDDSLNSHPRWTWRATPLRRVKRNASAGPNERPAVSVKLQVHYAGFKRLNGHRNNRYFHFIDSVAITGRTSKGNYPAMCEEESLRVWGERYREFCRINGTKLCNTRGSFGSAMLRDPRFIGDSERRIPAFINQTAREHLPGNHYELRTEPNQRVNGIYLDITNAHHEAASVTEFPDPRGLRARGLHRELPTTTQGREPWSPVASRKYSRLRRTHGLVLLRAQFRGIPKGSILHPASVRATVGRPNFIYAYTNEIPLLESSGFTITGIEAAWTSGRTSQALNKYAEHAKKTLEGASPEDRQWMKSLFISTYGMLGKRPSKYQSVSNLGGKSYDWPTPGGWLKAQLKGTSVEHSPVATNVIALGMIQAETRRNVIETARYLAASGVTVLALYADSIVVSDDSQLPFLPPEWRIKQSLTNLYFYDSVSWVADEDERLPGRSGIDRRARAIAKTETYVKSRAESWRFGVTDSYRGPDRAFKAQQRQSARRKPVLTEMSALKQNANSNLETELDCAILSFASGVSPEEQFRRSNHAA